MSARDSWCLLHTCFCLSQPVCFCLKHYFWLFLAGMLTVLCIMYYFHQNLSARFNFFRYCCVHNTHFVDPAQHYTLKCVPWLNEGWNSLNKNLLFTRHLVTFQGEQERRVTCKQRLSPSLSLPVPEAACSQVTNTFYIIFTSNYQLYTLLTLPDTPYRALSLPSIPDYTLY